MGRDLGLERLCPNSRGQWFDRLALNLQSHLKKPDEALEACTMGLNDVSVKDKDKVLLQVVSKFNDLIARIF